MGTVLAPDHSCLDKSRGILPHIGGPWRRTALSLALPAANERGAPRSALRFNVEVGQPGTFGGEPVDARRRRTSCNEDKPIIVFILMDNLGYGELGVYGGGIRELTAPMRVHPIAAQMIAAPIRKPDLSI